MTTTTTMMTIIITRAYDRGSGETVASESGTLDSMLCDFMCLDRGGRSGRGPGRSPSFHYCTIGVYDRATAPADWYVIISPLCKLGIHLFNEALRCS
jgi:hypothetical protein